jgi:hypothetical protein
LPKFKAGLQNTFTYKNFDFSFFLRGMFDYDVLNEGAAHFRPKTGKTPSPKRRPVPQIKSREEN